MDRSGGPVSSEAIPSKHYNQMCIQLNGLKGTCEHAPQLKKWNLRGHMWKNLSLHNQRKRLGRQKIHLEIFKWKLKTFKLSIFHVLIERSQCPYFDMTIQKKKKNKTTHNHYQCISRRKRWFPPVRFKPTPPAKREISMTFRRKNSISLMQEGLRIHLSEFQLLTVWDQSR